MGVLHILAVRRLSFKPLLIIVCFFLPWIDLHELQAQQLVINVGGGHEGKLKTYNQFNNFYEGKCDAAKDRLESLLHRIDRVCELSPKQRTHLEVAGKGAVVAYSEEILEKIELQAKSVGVEFDKGNPPEKDPDDEQDDGGAAGRRLMVLDFGGMAQLDSNVEAEKIWASSVKKTLTEAQAEKLKSWKIAKRKIIRQAAVGYFIAKADLKMFLSREQNEKLKGYVDKEYGPQLVEQMNAPPKQNRNLVMAGILRQKRDIKVDESLKEFLSESQLEIWKTDFQESLDSL